MEMQSIVSAFITIFSIGLLVISIIGYRKFRNKKLLFVSLVFLVFLVKGIILSLSLFFDVFLIATAPEVLGIFDVLILGLLFIATLKR